MGRFGSFILYAGGCRDVRDDGVGQGLPKPLNQHGIPACRILEEEVIGRARLRPHVVHIHYPREEVPRTVIIQLQVMQSLDTSTPSGRFVLAIFGAVAQLEREYLLQRQKEGIAIAKQEGKYTGRKPLDRPGQNAVLASWRNGKITAVEAMRTLKMSKTTFYRRVNQMERRERL